MNSVTWMLNYMYYMVSHHIGKQIWFVGRIRSVVAKVLYCCLEDSEFEL